MLRDQWLWDGVNWTRAATGTPDLGLAWIAAVPTGDRWFYLTADESWVGAATVANAQAVGVGCGGNLVSLRTDGDPVLGSSTFAVELHRAATNAPFLLGLGAGTARCTIYLPQLDDSRFGIAGPTGRAVVELPVPGAPQLLGLTVSLQAAALDATAPLGFALSNAIVAHVGL